MANPDFIADRFAICQAYQQLEADYNVDGWVRERPSNQRRNESIGIQLMRMGYENLHSYTDICAVPDPENGDPFDDNVRFIYLHKVLEWDLPIDEDMMLAIKRTFTEGFYSKFPQCAGVDYKQGS